MLNVAIENQYGWNYSAPAPHKPGAGRETRKSNVARTTALQAVFMREAQPHSDYGGACRAAARLAGFYVDRYFHPVRLTTIMVVESLGGELSILNVEAAIMATTLTLSP